MLKQMKSGFKRLTPARLIVLYYFLAVSVSFLLLRAPFALQPGVDLSASDALFVAVSAVSVTGLSTVDISQTFSVAGNYILMFVFQFGGIGVMALGTFFWLVLGKRIGLMERRLILTDLNQMGLSGLVKMLKEILILIFIIELVGALLLGTHFLRYFPSWEEAYLQGLFASVSATTNAGFDITGNSLAPFAKDYFVQIVNIILMTLGAIGFPVLMETKHYLLKKKNEIFRFSLFTKLTTITFGGLLVAGTLLILLLEANHYFKDMVWHEALAYSVFQSATTRSAGLATMDVSNYTVPTLLVMSGLIFIGASPSSVGGGIRTTTFALNVLFLYHFGRGRRTVKVFKRELTEEDLIKSLMVTMMAFFICFIATILLSITEQKDIVMIIFEVASAFGTNGLSMGLTPELTVAGKVIIMILMFIGRVGIISFLLFMGGKDKKQHIHYPKERVIIG